MIQTLKIKIAIQSIIRTFNNNPYKFLGWRHGESSYIQIKWFSIKRNKDLPFKDKHFHLLKTPHSYWDKGFIIFLVQAL